ncbi:MAG: hotdog domain-containing protein [Ignavibacteriota bacterium]
MHNIQIGAKREEQLLVNPDVAISFLALDDARVLATPEMIRYMERTSRNLAFPQLEPGHDTVGTHVNVSHLAAAPIGSVVTFTSEIISVEERRVGFRVTARTEQELIGEGHTRTDNHQHRQVRRPSCGEEAGRPVA